MTSGVKTPHWSGEKFTPRDLAFLQSLPYHHHLTGSWSQAIKQVGNMFPPIITELIYRLCAQTLEALDNGFIDADDDIDDLNVTLFEKGVDIPETPATSISLSDLTSPPPRSAYKYLSKPTLSDANTPNFSSAFARRKPHGSNRNKQGKRGFQAGEDYDEDYNEETPSPEETRHKRAATITREKAFWQEFDGKTIELSDNEDERM